MIFYYVRHGDPIYNPDGLTPLGFEQADALKYRLCRYGLDRIYASSSNRAILTAKPTAELLKKEIQVMDWCNEKYAYSELGMKNDEGFYTWCYNHTHIKKLFLSEEVRLLGENWYDHKAFEGTTLKDDKGINTLVYNPEEKSLLMRVDATKIYEGKPHIAEEYKWWPHLLLTHDQKMTDEQKARNTLAVDRIFAELDVRLLDFKDTINKEGLNVCDFLV